MIIWLRDFKIQIWISRHDLTEAEFCQLANTTTSQSLDIRHKQIYPTNHIHEKEYIRVRTIYSQQETYTYTPAQNESKLGLAESDLLRTENSDFQPWVVFEFPINKVLKKWNLYKKKMADTNEYRHNNFNNLHLIGREKETIFWK